jgi:hypothetical protein
VRRWLLVAGLGVAVLMGLFPPWLYTVDAPGFTSSDPAGYSFIAAPPSRRFSRPIDGVRFDVTRLLVQWTLVAGGLGATLLLVQRR